MQKILKSNKGFRRYVPGGKCRRGASVAGGKCLGGKCRAVLQSAPECYRVIQFSSSVLKTGFPVSDLKTLIFTSF